MADPREQTNRLLEMIDDGQLDPMMAVTMCVKWMSEDDVAEMLDANELSERFEEDDEDDYDDDDYDDSMDGDHDSAMASAGFGTDEDYGYYGEEY